MSFYLNSLHCLVGLNICIIIAINYFINGANSPSWASDRDGMYKLLKYGNIGIDLRPDAVDVEAKLARKIVGQARPQAKGGISCKVSCYSTMKS